MPTFPRGFINHSINVANAKMLEQLARETGGNITIERTKLYGYSAGDELTLRGIPAIGRGVQGAIPGTNPERRVAA